MENRCGSERSWWMAEKRISEKAMPLGNSTCAPKVWTMVEKNSLSSKCLRCNYLFRRFHCYEEKERKKGCRRFQFQYNPKVCLKGIEERVRDSSRFKKRLSSQRRLLRDPQCGNRVGIILLPPNAYIWDGKTVLPAIISPSIVIKERRTILSPEINVCIKNGWNLKGSWNFRG